MIFPEVRMYPKIIVSVFFLSLIMSASNAFCVTDSTARAADSTHQKWWAQLNLSEDQKAKLKTLRVDMKDFRKANFEKMKSILDKSKEELLKAAPSKVVLYGYAKEMGDLHKAMSEHMADHMLKMKTILSKEQFQKLLKNNFLHGMGHPGNGPRPPHDGPHGMASPPPHDMDD
jgi:Spy/CpxP family protein refolding chaperone